VATVKRIRHIPDAARPGRTYCGRQWDGSAWSPPWRLPIIDIARDCIDDAECKACQRSDDRRTREAYAREMIEHLVRIADGD
jgi:hypothetical protein